LIGYYFIKLKPQIEKLQKELITAANQEVGQSLREQQKSQDLSECTTNFLSILGEPSVSKSLKSFTELSEFKDFAVETCMQKKGYNYKN